MTPDLTFFAVLAGIAAVWSHVHGILERFRALVVTRVTIYSDTTTSIVSYLHAKGQVINWGDLYLQSTSTWVRPAKRVLEVLFEKTPVQPRLVWLNKRLIMFCSPAGTGANHSSNIPEDVNILVLTSLRGWLNVKQLTRDALEWAQDRKNSGHRYCVRQVRGSRVQVEQSTSSGPFADRILAPSGTFGRLKYLHWTEDEIGAPLPADPFSALSLCDVGHAAVQDFRRWLSLKDWYQERGIPWRRGHLYYGPPGTGKTSLTRAIAQSADMPVFAYDLSTLDNIQFSEAWQNMREATPCIALIEDIDGTFHDRDNVLKSDKRDTLTFDCFLNALGGIETCDGVFLVITTNKPELLADALGRPDLEGGGTSRPGRLDAAYCLKLPAVEQRREIITRICQECPEELIYESEGQSAAKVTELAIVAALNKMWSAKDEPK